MIFFVYVIYSLGQDRFYVGQTENLERRIQEHNSHYFGNASTKVSNDWVLFYSLACESRKQAVNIETHIKKAKSRSYYTSLKKYPEVGEKLLQRFSV